MKGNRTWSMGKVGLGNGGAGGHGGAGRAGGHGEAGSDVDGVM